MTILPSFDVAKTEWRAGRRILARKHFTHMEAGLWYRCNHCDQLCRHNGHGELIEHLRIKHFRELPESEQVLI